MQMRDSGAMQPEEVLDLIRRQPRGRISYKTLARLLRLNRNGRSELDGVLERLAADGKLVAEPRGRYRLLAPDRNVFAGRLSVHARGFGFFAPDRPIPKLDGQDLYIGPRSLGSAMHGDRVKVRLLRVDHEGRASGRVESVLERVHEHVVGRFSYSPHGSHVTPLDEHVPGPIRISRGAELPPPERRDERLGNVTPPKADSPSKVDGMIVTVAVDEFAGPYGKTAVGRVVELLGYPKDFGVDVEIMIRKHHLPYRFPAEALAQADDTDSVITAAEIQARRDFRDLDAVTIDGETARDFDDAVWVDRRAEGGFVLHVHIADVSHYVQPGSALDFEARNRGTSVYFPDRAVPMLPSKLSTDVCSLNPDVDRLTLSVLAEMNPAGEIVKAEFCRGVIHSSARMTYTDVAAVFEGDEETRKRYKHLVPRFELMRDLATVLIKRREKRGAMDLDLPEPVIEFDDEGRMTGVSKAPRTMANRVIEELMLAANEAVARRLDSVGAGYLHRIHETPSPRAVAELEQTLRLFGHSLGIELRKRPPQRGSRGRGGSRGPRDSQQHALGSPITSRHYQKLAEKLRGRPEERVLHFRMLRSMQQARYHEEPRGHFALATDAYLHFTSPIRRYPDLIVHRVLKAILDREQPPYSVEELAQLSDETSFRERRAVDAERELIEWKKSRFLEQRLGEEFEGRVTSVIEAGMFVELKDLYIEGFVPVDSFLEETFRFQERARALIGARSKTEYHLGDQVRVRVDRVNFERMRAELSCLGKS